EQYRQNPQIVSIIYNDQNSGSPFKQWKKGIELARGNFIWIAESDDYCTENFLTIAMGALRDSSVDLFYCKSIYVNEKNISNDKLMQWYADLGAQRWENNYEVS